MRDIHKEACEKHDEGHADSTNHFNDLWRGVVDQRGHDSDTTYVHHILQWYRSFSHHDVADAVTEKWRSHQRCNLHYDVLATQWTMCSFFKKVNSPSSSSNRVL